MRLHVMSDLHLEIRSQSQRDQFWTRLRTHVEDPPDALVLAGDIGSIRKKYSNLLLEALHQFEDLYPEVFYVPGNHEFWKVGLAHGWEILDRWQGQLPRTTILKTGIRIHGHMHDQADISEEVGGDTLWYPDCGDPLLKRWWCDYQEIPDSHAQIHARHQKFLTQTDLPDLMITHHFPTPESIASRWRGENTNVFFCADLEGWLTAKSYAEPSIAMPRVWIHGHTHDPMDFRSRGGFRVYCNPLGYPNEGSNPGFWERLQLDTDPRSWEDPTESDET